MINYVKTDDSRECDGCGDKSQYEFQAEYVIKIPCCRSCAVELADQIREEVGDE